MSEGPQWSRRRLPTSAGQWLEVAVLAAVHVGAARLSQQVALPTGEVAPVWFPSGVMIAWALVRGLWVWPGILLGAAVVSASTHLGGSAPVPMFTGLGVAAIDGLGHAICTVIGVIFARRVAGDRLAPSPRVALSFLLGAALLGPFLRALLGAGARLGFGLVSLPVAKDLFWTWWVASGVGVVLLGPPIASWWADVDESDASGFAQLTERIGWWMVAVLVVTTIWVLGPQVTGGAGDVAMLALVVWAAGRMRIRFVFGSVVTVSVARILVTSYSAPPVGTSFLPLEVFLGALASTALLVMSAMVVSRRMQAETGAEVPSSPPAAPPPAAPPPSVELEEALRDPARLLRLATEDSLTGLANRARLDMALEDAHRTARRTGVPFAVIFLDLDHFKEVNDVHGHAAGDLVLQAVAARLTGAVREVDVVARIGGDEFVVLMPSTKGAEHALAAAERIVAAFARPFDLVFSEGGPPTSITMGVSGGVALGDAACTSPAEVVEASDAAMYEVKNRGRGAVTLAAASDKSDCEG